MTRFLIACLVAALFGAACSKSESKQEGQQTPASSPTQTRAAKAPAAAKKLIAEGAAVLDVRAPEDFAEAHLPNARNIPLEEIASRTSEVEQLVGGDKTKPIVVYCYSGNRAAKAISHLEGAGFTQLVNGGGFDDLR